MQRRSTHWGKGSWPRGVAPSRWRRPGFMEWAGRLERLAASPGTIERIFELIGEFDVRHVLPSIRVPTLVMHRRDGHLHQGGALALHRRAHPGRALRGARGRATTCSRSATPRRSSARSRSSSPATRHDARARPHARHGDVHRHRATPPGAPPSWATAAGARCWSATTSWSGGRSSATAAARSSARATASSPPSTGPARAIRCAASITEARADLGLELRAGLHTGELEVMSDDLGGLAVHIARARDGQRRGRARCSCRAR